MEDISNRTARNFRINHKKIQNLNTSRNISHYVQGNFTIYLGELLGTGGFGSVYKVLELYTKEQAAVKIMKIKGKSKEILHRIYK